MTDLVTSENRSLTTLRARTERYRRAVRAENTRRAYKSQWATFCAFCGASGYTVRPASPIVVVDYLTHLAEAGRKVSTITVASAAISFAHRGMEDPTKSDDVKTLLEGMRRELGVAGVQKAPIKRAELRKLLAALPGDTLAGARDRALLLLGYAGAFRRSELVGLTVSDLRFDDDGLVITLRRSKTDQTGEGTFKHIPRISNMALCPVTAMRAWLHHAKITSGPVFRKVDRWGKPSRTALGDRAVAEIIKRTARAADLPAVQFSGHSLRSGFATQGAIDGLSPLDIREVTGHKSDKMLARYVRAAGVTSKRAVRTVLGEE